MDADRKKTQERDAAKQDPAVKTVREQQHTGNHEAARQPNGPDLFGGTRAGAENVEPVPSGRKPPRT
ncbi:hypothetical protein STVA_09090 [Allostella vacuolata]|nr:hypothetical protein STVA_09090 [Stella vacuolata]